MELFFFIVSLLGFLAVSAYVFRLLTFSKDKDVPRWMHLAACVGEVILLLTGLLGYLFVGALAHIRGICVTLGCAGALAFFAVTLLKAKKKLPISRGWMVFAKALLVVVLLECLIFNMDSMQMLNKQYPQKQLNMQTASISGLTRQGDDMAVTATEKSTKVSVTFYDIDIPVESIYLNIEMNDDTAYSDAQIYYRDEMFNKAFRTSYGTPRITKGQERSQFLHVESSGMLDQLKLTFELNKGEGFRLHGVTTNLPIPFEFSFLRVVLLLSVVMGIYALLNGVSLKSPLGEQLQGWQRLAYSVTIMVMILLMVGTMVRNDGIKRSDFRSNTGDQISQELVDAFEKGHVYLDKEPSETMLSLENPYDWSERLEKKVNFEAWDHVLYEGKYYSYYGIAPVFLLFLPYHLLTDCYFPTTWAVPLFSMIGTWFLTMTYLALLKRKFPKLPCNMALMGLLVLQLTKGLLFSCLRPFFYEIAISSAFSCITAGSYFLISSNIVWGEKTPTLWRLTLGSTLMALSVLCRPTMAVYCIAAVVFLGFGVWQIRKQKGKWLLVLLCAGIPFVVLGGVQMWYNYARFGSILEFGIQYSLTINDFTRSQFYGRYQWIGYLAFLFMAPTISPAFPYLVSQVQYLNTNGYYFMDNMTFANNIGLVFKALPVWGYLKAKKAYGFMDKTTRCRDMTVLLLWCVAAPLVIIFSVWESGFSLRYFADISWQVVLGALSILFVLFLNETDKHRRRAYEKFFAISVAVALVTTATLTYSTCIIFCSGNTAQSVMEYFRYTFEVFR